MKILSLKVLKIGDSYQVPNINLSSEILDTKSLKYYLHQGFTDKKKIVKKNSAVELDALAAGLDYYVEQSNEKISMNIFSRAKIESQKIPI